MSHGALQYATLEQNISVRHRTAFVLFIYDRNSCVVKNRLNSVRWNMRERRSAGGTDRP